MTSLALDPLAPADPLATALAVPSVLPASTRRPPEDALPLPEPLRGLLPEGAMRRGATLILRYWP